MSDLTQMKLPISLTVITFNEERNLARCLGSASFCDELIVVDSGSTDRTREIAESYGALFVARPWTGYRDQKNFATDLATQPWVLCIDADEEVSSELQAGIRKAFESDPDCDAFDLNRHSYYAGKLINHSGWFPQWRTFLYRKGFARWGGSEPHTTVQFTGSRKRRLRGDLYHHTYSDIRHHMSKLVHQAYEGARAMRGEGRRATWLDLIARAPWAVFRAYVIDLGFLDGFYGLVISASYGYYTFLKYSMLHEFVHADRREET